MADGKRRTLKDWREARNLTLEAAARAARANPTDLKKWERDGYPNQQGEPGRAIHLADAYNTPLEMIDYGPNIWAFTEAGCQFVIATGGRDDRGWESFVAEWRSPERGTKQAPEGVSGRASTGMRTKGLTSKDSLDILEEEIRPLIRQVPAGADDQ